MKSVLVGGTDTHSVSKFIDKRKKEFLETEKEAEVVSIYADEVSHINEIPFLRGDIGFFSSATLIVIKNLMSMGGPDLREQLLHHLQQQESVGDSKVEVIIAEFGNVDKRQKLYKHYKSKKRLQLFSEPKEAEKKAYIKEQLWQRNLEVKGDALVYLSQILVTKPMPVIISELEKLILLKQAQDSRSVQLSDLEILNKDTEAQIWQLFEYSFTNKQEAFALLDRLLDQEVHHLQIVGFLAAELRKILHYRHNSNRLSGFIKSKVSRRARQISDAKLRLAINKLLDLDVAFKSTNLDPRLGLSVYLSLL
jgi:DNA polymerase III delta subunit